MHPVHKSSMTPVMWATSRVVSDEEEDEEAEEVPSGAGPLSEAVIIRSITSCCAMVDDSEALKSHMTLDTSASFSANRSLEVRTHGGALSALVVSPPAAAVDSGQGRVFDSFHCLSIGWVTDVRDDSKKLWAQSQHSVWCWWLQRVTADPSSGSMKQMLHRVGSVDIVCGWVGV